jgi:nucleoside-triphosphatase
MSSNKFILLTGMPGVGKTTLVKHVIEDLKSCNIKFQGFYSTEKRRDNERIGFDIVKLNDEQSVPLARIR